MYNLLSYQPGTSFTGAEIKEWARQTLTARDENKRKIACWVLYHYRNLRDNRTYNFHLDYRSDNYSTIRVPIFHKE